MLQDLRKEPEQARVAYAKAAELGSTNDYTFYRSAQLAWKADAGDDVFVRIAQNLERALALKPESALALSFLAEVKVRLNQAAEAEPLARKAVTLEPGRTYHRVALARVHWALGRRAEALAEAQRGLSLSKNDNDRSNAQNMLDFLQR